MLTITCPNLAHDGWELRTAQNGVASEQFAISSEQNRLCGTGLFAFSNKDTTAFFFGVHDFAGAALSASSLINIAIGAGFYKAPGDDALIFLVKDGADQVSVALGDIVADTFYKLEYQFQKNGSVKVWVNDAEYSLTITAAALPADTVTLGGAIAFTSTGTAQPTCKVARAFQAQIRG